MVPRKPTVCISWYSVSDIRWWFPFYFPSERLESLLSIAAYAVFFAGDSPSAVVVVAFS